MKNTDLAKLPSFSRSFISSRGFGAASRSGRASTAASSKDSTKSLAPQRDAEAEARDKIMATLLQKRRVMMAGFKEEDLRDVADVVKYGPDSVCEQESNAPMIIHIRNALSVKPSDRMHASDAIIMSMLTHTVGLAEYLKYCSENDLNNLSKMCTSFVVSDVSEHVIATAGAVIDECYIVIKGNVERYQNPSLHSSDLEATVTPDGVTILDGWVSRCGKATILGLDVLDNRVKWDSDYVAHNGTCICTVPTNALKRFVGSGGFRATDVMECFWRYYKLWEYIYDNELKMMRLTDPLFGSPATFSNDLTKIDNTPRLPINVTSCGRIKNFSPGQEIFTQGDSREYLYILILGEASYVHRFPEWVEDIPVEVSIGLTLYPGDFSFMDGEEADWAIKNRKAHLEQEHLQEEIDESQEYDRAHNDAYRLLFASKLRNRELIKSRYGSHKNTLLATTRTEVCVIPLSAVADCQNAFKGLLVVAVGKYRLTLYSDEDLIRRFHENRIWSQQKARIIGKTLGTDLAVKSPTVHSASTTMRPSKINISDTNSTRPNSPRAKTFPGSLDGGGSSSEITVSHDDIEIGLDRATEPVPEPQTSGKVILLVNPRQYSRPGSRVDSKSSVRSPSPEMNPRVPSSDSDHRKESVHRSAIQGVNALAAPDGTAKPPRANSSIEQQKNLTLFKGGSLSDRIKSFYKATADHSILSSSDKVPTEPTRPTGLKKSTQSVRARKSNKQAAENVENGGNNARNRRQLTFIEEDSVGELSSTSNGAARLDGVEVNPLLNGRTSRAKSKRDKVNSKVDNSELSLLCFAEKNADMYVQKFRKKQIEMRSLDASLDNTVLPIKGIDQSQSVKNIPNKTDPSSQEAFRSGVITESAGRRKMNMDEIISNLANATAKSGSR